MNVTGYFSNGKCKALNPKAQRITLKA